MEIGFMLNGAFITVHAEPETRLIDVLRQDLGLTGTKEGCGTGHCGSCTVLINGQPRQACSIRAVRVQGQSVLTIEGLGTGGSLHPIQQAFVAAGAVQCGFCTPGMVLRAKALLDANPDPTEADIRRAFSRHLCRCTGYIPIINAVRLASRLLQGEPAAVEEVQVADTSGVGAAVLRLDAPDKTTGACRYAADLPMAGVLQGAILRSPHSHALIRDIDVRAARSLPGVVAVITAADIPGPNLVGPIVPDRPVLAHDRVRYLGEPVAAVAATSRAIARQALDTIKITYEVLPLLDSPAAALAPEAPKLHQGGNVVPCPINRVIHGDVAAGFEQCAVVIEKTYTTPFNEHAYLEPEAGLACYDEQGRLVVYCATQDAYEVRDDIATNLGLDRDRVRVIQTPVGGAFGGRLDSCFQVILAALCHHCQQPVRVVFDRAESFLASYKRHPFVMRYRTGATADGRILAADIDIVGDAGAYAFRSPAVLGTAVAHAQGPYEIPNVRINGKMVYTNNPVTGAMRGFGVPQVHYAMETQVDLMAQALGMDPLEFRARNVLRPGSVTATGQVLGQGIGLLPSLESIRPYYLKAKQEVQALNAAGGTTRRGVGISSFWFGIGRIGKRTPAGTRLTLLDDGRVELACGAADVGQGSTTTLVQIAAATLQMPMAGMVAHAPDTTAVPPGDATCASRQTYFSGNAARLAAEGFRTKYVQTAAGLFGEQEADLDPGPGLKLVSRRTGRSYTRAEVAAGCREKGVKLSCEAWFDPVILPLDENGQGVPFLVYSNGAYMAEVEVDPARNETRVIRVVAAQDVGKVVNPQQLTVQIYAATLMGLGFALMEKFIPGQTKGYHNYRIPTINDVPEILPIYIETGEPTGPYGAKGAGESPVVATAAAIMNAVADACGRHFYNLPLNLNESGS